MSGSATSGPVMSGSAMSGSAMSRMPSAGAAARVPARVPVRALRLAVGGLGLFAVGLSGGAGPLGDLAVLVGAIAALATAWLPDTPAPWAVVAAAVLPRFSGPAGVDAELLAQVPALLLFHALAGQLALVAPARTVELRALLPGLLRCAVALVAVLPALLLAAAGPELPEVMAAVAAAVTAALLVLLARVVRVPRRPAARPAQPNDATA